MRHEFKGGEKKEVWLLEQIMHEEREQTDILRCLINRLFPEVTSYTVTQIGDPMLQAPAPGNTLVFTATEQPAGSALPAGAAVPSWTSSDPVNAPVTVDATGLVATVVLSPTIPVGQSVTLSVSATYTSQNGNGSITATGSATFTTVAQTTPPPPDVTSFSVAQTA